MRDYEAYRREYSEAQEYFGKQISDREGKSFEYGVIVLKSAITIAGGSLLSIPAIIGLNPSAPVYLGAASKAGLCFAMALITSIIGAYIIHLNWSFHVSFWQKHWEARRVYLRKIYLEDVPEECLDFEEGHQDARRITITFWVPHVLAFIYLGLVITGFIQLYMAFGVTA